MANVVECEAADDRELCDHCGWKGNSIAHHQSKWPECRVRPFECHPRPTAERPGSDAARVCHALEFDRMLGGHVEHMFLQKIMRKAHIQCAVDLANDAVNHVCARIINNLERVAPAAVPSVRATLADALLSIAKLNDVDATCERQCRQPIPRTVDRPLLGLAKIRKKHYAFFSVYELLADMLQNDQVKNRTHRLAPPHRPPTLHNGKKAQEG